jgi:hypothetical protein
VKDFLRHRGPTAIAVALAFVAGGATVTTAQSLVTGADIKDGSIKTADLANGAVNSAKIADGQVKTADLANGAVNSAKIADGQVKAADVANNSLTGTDINEGSLGQVPSAGKVDGKDANQLTRVTRMTTSDTTAMPPDGTEVTYGTALTITAPTAGFVTINGSTTVLWNGCTTSCYFYSRIRHLQTGRYSTPAEGSLYAELLTNLSNAYVFPVNAGTNAFQLRLSRAPDGDGELDGWYGELSALYTPFGPSGAGTLSATAATEVPKVPTADEPKPLPGG